ncbi:MAG: hypothetical protein KUA37_07465 [Desulfomicrobium sp.]|nr:hypothetical protein [Pseudomonadota bacterium]MBV1711829.1 hypothetical protein [Desulfomicrobium sp.]MBU4572583.1 hypothetical protein [Pseudomonadota bacterium]MBU4593636.1 hypothetical protein [Pseudomonadota bacterium]MBV1719109.1 hypothetical protein [Desulfomicrobium sp.]
MNTNQSEEIKLWRYIDWGKLKSLLQDRAIFFPRASKFIDEGATPKANRKERFFAELERENFRRCLADYTYISCWHMNEHESNAMWQIYADNKKGFAIKTTDSRLKRSLDYHKFIVMGPIKYIDFERDENPGHQGSSITPFFYKDLMYKSEDEFRAVIYDGPSQEVLDGAAPSNPFVGMSIPVDLNVLVERIVVGPSYTNETFDDVLMLVKDTFKGDSSKVEISKMCKKPKY